jgi:hypothetical protein
MSQFSGAASLDPLEGFTMPPDPHHLFVTRYARKSPTSALIHITSQPPSTNSSYATDLSVCLRFRHPQPVSMPLSAMPGRLFLYFSEPLCVNAYLRPTVPYFPDLCPCPLQHASWVLSHADFLPLP